MEGAPNRNGKSPAAPLLSPSGPWCVRAAASGRFGRALRGRGADGAVWALGHRCGSFETLETRLLSSLLSSLEGFEMSMVQVEDTVSWSRKKCIGEHGIMALRNFRSRALHGCSL